jgi:dienelactone hydrolase
MTLYQEPETTGAPHREKYLAQLLTFIEQEEGRRRLGRAGLTGDLEGESPRARFLRHLGWPLTLASPAHTPPVRERFVAEDELGRIYRVWIESLPGLETYALYFRPHGRGPFPLVISQHGGLGTPEICSGLHDSANYNNMSRRVHARGMAVLAPQLLMWRETYGPPFDHAAINLRLRGLGGTLTALEVWQLQRALDAFSARPEVDPQRIGMVGLSYGGYYTQFMAAADPRIRAALNSCYLFDPLGERDREIAWIETDPAFGFREMIELIAPRAFYMETGATDDLVPAAKAPPLVAQARAVYANRGLPERYRYKNHPGWHEFDPAEDGIDFLVEQLAN